MTVSILIGDCRDVLAGLADESVDAIVTDPPYNQTSLPWDRWPAGWPAAARRVLKRTGSMWVFGSLRMFMERRDEFAGWMFAQDVVWEKHNGSGFQADRFRRVHEQAAQFYRDDALWEGVYKGKVVTYDAKARVVRKKAGPQQHMGALAQERVYRSEEGGPLIMRSVIYVRSEHGRAVHPTQKPLGIVHPLVENACPPGGVVLDPFIGSGTTAIVAQESGRDCIGIELRPECVEIARTRINGEAPLFAAAAE